MTKPFTLAVLPDTQIYAESYPHIFTAQTQWIADNKDALNIVFVLHAGDITNHNVPYHWKNASDSMRVLDEVVPYAIVMGNHDMGPGGDCSVRESLFNNYFPVSRYQALSTFGGTFERGMLDSSFHLFNAGGTAWLLLALEYLPRDQVLKWAAGVLESHPHCRVIILTHSYVHPDSSLFGSNSAHNWNPEDYGISSQPGGVNNAAQTWDKLMRHHPNISLVVSGHFVGNSISYQDGAARVIGIGERGNRVLQMLANYQHMEEGGGGFMRLIVCDPSNDMVSVRTYSPNLDAYLTDADNQFTVSDVSLGPMLKGPLNP